MLMNTAVVEPLAALTIGKPFHPAADRWPAGAKYNYERGRHQLLLGIPNPSGAEVEAVKAGTVDFVLHVEPPVIVLGYQFGGGGPGIPWADATFDWHRQEGPPEETIPPDPAEVHALVRGLVQIILVDAETGIVRAVRVVSFSPAFTAALHTAIRAQAAAPPPGARFQATLARIDRQYNSTAELAAAAQVYTRGGA